MTAKASNYIQEIHSIAEERFEHYRKAVSALVSQTEGTFTASMIKDGLEKYNETVDFDQHSWMTLGQIDTMLWVLEGAGEVVLDESSEAVALVWRKAQEDQEIDPQALLEEYVTIWERGKNWLTQEPQEVEADALRLYEIREELRLNHGDILEVWEDIQEDQETLKKAGQMDRMADGTPTTPVRADALKSGDEVLYAGKVWIVFQVKDVDTPNLKFVDIILTTRENRDLASDPHLRVPCYKRFDKVSGPRLEVVRMFQVSLGDLLYLGTGSDEITGTVVGVRMDTGRVTIWYQKSDGAQKRYTAREGEIVRRDADWHKKLMSK